MKTISMTVAILLAIKEFGNDVFSIHDITKNIRKNLNDSVYQLRYMFDQVDHNDVKDYFTELVDSGLLDDYYVRYNPSGYREYSKNGSTSSPVNNPQTTHTQVIPRNTVPAAPSTTKIPTDVQVIVYKYMKNNGPVTMKQIQSRLKGHPYTCEDIAQFLDKINLIDPVSKILPYSRMSTVAI